MDIFLLGEDGGGGGGVDYSHFRKSNTVPQFPHPLTGAILAASQLCYEDSTS